MTYRVRGLSRGDLAAFVALLVLYIVEGPRPASGPLARAAQAGTLSPTRVVTAVAPSATRLEQPIRYRDLMEKVPAAFSPLLAAHAPPPGCDPAATIDTLVHGERASTFLMTRGYYDFVRSGASGATLAEVFAIGRPLIQFRRDWVWLVSRRRPASAG